MTGEPECGDNNCWRVIAIEMGAPIACKEANPTLAGCYCQSGYARNDQNICIPTSECPRSNDCNSHMCGTNEVYSECGAAEGCQNTCESPDRSKFTKCTCISGCICVDGFVRDNNYRCVLLQDCLSY